MPTTALPVRAATEIAIAHGIVPDRCGILQNSSTLIVRLTDSLVARVVQDLGGPRQGTAWFARENAIANHLTAHGAPVIPLHPGLPPGPYEHLGYPVNFWEFVSRVDKEPCPHEIGSTLFKCHRILRSFPDPLPSLSILSESLEILRNREMFTESVRQLLVYHVEASLCALAPLPHQPLHGDAHMGNLMQTTRGLLWTDWEDTFSGPVEWDLASIIWNLQILEGEHSTVQTLLAAYSQSGGSIDERALHQCLIARAAVVTAWYPILYPTPNRDRQEKLRRRITWLESMPRGS